MTAQEDERRRMARELHDGIGQALTTLLVGFGALGWKEMDPDARNQLGRLRELTARTLEDIRRLARGLRPSVLDDLGLEAALRQWVAEFSETHGVIGEVQFVGADKGRLPPAVETTLYRIVQEGLTNAVRHAAPTTVSVVIQRRNSETRLVIEDDGHGFDVETVLETVDAAHGIGLYHMRERVGLLGGTMSIESEPGKGTTIYVRVPV